MAAQPTLDRPRQPLICPADSTTAEHRLAQRPGGPPRAGAGPRSRRVRRTARSSQPFRRMCRSSEARRGDDRDRQHRGSSAPAGRPTPSQTDDEQADEARARRPWWIAALTAFAAPIVIPW